MIPGAIAAQAQDETPDESRLNVLYFNDFHGRIDNYNDLTVGFAATIEELRAADGEENTLVISGGDNIGGSLFNSSAQQDAPAIDVLNAIDLDASVVGNHEFDRGIDDLQGRVLDRAEFPFLAANVTFDGAVAADGGYVILERGGVNVAIIGAVTQDTPALVDQEGIAGVEFTDPVDAVNEIAERLKGEGLADVVIATYHEGATVELAANAPQETQAAALQTAISEQRVFERIVNETSAEVDVILNGHTHKRYTWLAPVPGADGETRPVVQTGEYAANIGQIPLIIDNATGEITVDTEGFALVPTGETEIPADNVRVEAVKTIVADAIAAAAVIGNTPIEGAVLEADITTAHEGGAFEDGVYTGGARDDRGNASAMGTLVANMYRDVLSSEQRGGAEIGIVNPGGLRAELRVSDMIDNEMILRQAVEVLPFANNLFTTTLTGADLRAVLEQQWQPEEASRSYLQLGLSDNVRYTYDSSRDRDDRITGIWVDGVAVTDDQEFRVAIPSFLVSGGDNFTAFTAGTNAQDGGIVDSDGLMQYVADLGTVAPDFRRAQLEIAGIEPGATFNTGDEIEFTVNKIDLTSHGAPLTETLDVYIGEQRVAQAAVEANSAEVSFTVPEVEVAAEAAGTTGAPLASISLLQQLFAQQSGETQVLPLTLRSAASGTIIEVPVTVDVDVVLVDQPTSPTPPESVETATDAGAPLALLAFVLGAAVVAAAAYRARQRA